MTTKAEDKVEDAVEKVAVAEIVSAEAEAKAAASIEAEALANASETAVAAAGAAAGLAQAEAAKSMAKSEEENTWLKETLQSQQSQISNLSSQLTETRAELPKIAEQIQTSLLAGMKELLTPAPLTEPEANLSLEGEVNPKKKDGEEDDLKVSEKKKAAPRKRGFF